MPIYWRSEKHGTRLAIVERHGDFYHVRAKHDASGQSVLLLIVTDELDAHQQADLWHQRLTENPDAKMHWVMAENRIHDLRLDDLRHDADLERT